MNAVAADTAEAMRRHGLEVLTDEHRAILQQAEQTTLNERELEHLRRVEDALETLQAMRSSCDAPPGPSVSLCVICDAPPLACEHHAARYLEPLVYEVVRNEAGRITGYRVPEQERERWESEPATGPARSNTETPVPLADLTDAVSQLIEVSVPLERLLGTLYERDPLAVSRLVTRTLDDAATGNVRSLGGLLYTRLRDSSKT